MTEANARRIVELRSIGMCELCREKGTDWAHRRAAGQGGGWRPANGIRMCRRCHAWCEENPRLADLGGWRLVHRDEDPATVPVWLQGLAYPRGWMLLDDDGCVTWIDHVDVGLPDVPQLPTWVLQGR